MNEILQRNLNNGFRDFAGLSLSGSVPVKEELVNEMLGTFLTDLAGPTAHPPASANASAAGPDVKSMLRLLKKASVHATPGVITLNFELNA